MEGSGSGGGGGGAEELCMEVNPSPRQQENASATAEDWRKALDKVVPAVVVLRATGCRAFDTELASCFEATGFVVDKRRGIILTNRHVVTPGPVVAEAVFLNGEEVPVHPIYRDPVHDFGFFRYDPSAIHFLNYEEIPLAPEVACVGLEIRVIGNDSCEKMSILAGTIARLDRDAPHYKKTGYNDFNTFYMQAASGTKGGSSGSPVVDWQGRAVALNAGANLSSSSSAFFLPLERVVRALRFLQQGSEAYAGNWKAVLIPRGTLQVTFLHKGFDETRRLGLQSETEQIVRHACPADETGMLVVDSVVPGGPAYEQLEPGDVLVRMNGEVTTQFLKLETLLDDEVNNNVVLEIERAGKSKRIVLLVQDLHLITPFYFFEVSGAVIHPLSYQQARNFRFPCGLVYVAEPGYMLSRAGVPRHAIIKKVASEEISCLEELISVLAKLSRGSRVPLEYVSYEDRHQRKSVLVTIDRHEWFAPPQIHTRDDSTGLWIPKPAFQPNSLFLSSGVKYIGNLAGQPDSLPSEHASITHIETNNENHSEHESQNNASDGGAKEQRMEKDLSANGTVITDFLLNETRETKLEKSTTIHDGVLINHQGEAAANASLAECVVEPALVMFEVHVPPSCLLDGVHLREFFGTGVIVHHSQDMGLVAVDKNTVAISSSDVMLSFAAFPVEIPGEVVFLHPVYNYALISYDPSALGAVGASAVRAAELLPEPALRRGDSVYLVGLNRSLEVISRKSVITNPCAALNIGSSDLPRYRATNMEVIELDADFGPTFTGVLTDEQGRVQAIWGSFSKIKQEDKSEDDQFNRGIPIYAISQVLHKILSGANGPPLLINGVKRPTPLVRILEVELYPTLLSKARSFGLNDEWIQAIVKKDPVRRKVLRVKRCLAGSKAENLLEQGDMVLAINKEPVTCFRDIENACQELDKVYTNDGKLHMTIFRQGQEFDLLVGTDVRDGNGTTRAVHWCGCVVQDPHPEVRALGFLPKGHGVYVTRWRNGSPAARNHLYACRWIVEVNEKPTPNLDAFVDVTKELNHGEFVRVKTVNLSGKPRLQTLKQDLHYWPTWELRFDPDTAIWRRTIIKALDCGSV